jgi:hypothetical protein
MQNLYHYSGRPLLSNLLFIGIVLSGCAGNGANLGVEESFILSQETTQAEEPLEAEDQSESESGDTPTQAEEPLEAEDQSESESGDAPTQAEEPLEAEDQNESESGDAPAQAEEPLEAEDQNESGLVAKDGDFNDILPDGEQERILSESSDKFSEESLILYKTNTESELKNETQSEETFYIYIPED